MTVAGAPIRAICGRIYTPHRRICWLGARRRRGRPGDSIWDARAPALPFQGLPTSAASGLAPRRACSNLQRVAGGLFWEGAKAKAMTATPVGAANLLGGVTLLPPTLPLVPACSPGANPDCPVGRRWRWWRHSPS
jgi:hypothetical protein